MHQLLLSYRLSQPKITHMYFFCCRTICTTAYMKFNQKTVDRQIFCHKRPIFGPPKTGPHQQEKGGPVWFLESVMRAQH